jgi:hypothetical protein
MPRLYTSSSDPIDFCIKCFPKENKAKALYNDCGDGPDNRGNCFDYNSDHPDYYNEDYRCEKCKRILTSDDN